MTDQQSFYDAVGGAETFHRLVAAFYRGVATDPELRALYPEEDLGPAEVRFRMFLEQYWGGPRTYSEQRGHPRLRMRHAPFAVTPRARDLWLGHMRAALDELALSPERDQEIWTYMVMAAQSMVNTDEPQYPGAIDVYDISADCRNPQPLAAGFPGSTFGHESGMAPDGMTFYPTSIGTDDTTAVDISNPRLPRQLWTAKINTHGMSVSDDGNRGYFATGDGLVIADLSEVQARKLNPQVREISRLRWSNMTIPQIAIPVTIGGRPYLVEIDEYSQNSEGGSVAANGSRVGAARIIDISDETRPRVVSNIRLKVHQPENRAAIANDYGAQSQVQGYAGHYCNVPRRAEPGILACSMILSGLRVFDIRDPEHPKEIAYFMAPPSSVSNTGSPIIDERANWAMSQPAFAAERNEIWYSDGTSGFYALKLSDSVTALRDPRPGSGASCVDNRSLAHVGVRQAARGVRLRFGRRTDLPVRVDVLRVSKGRRIHRHSRHIASFNDRTGSFTWHKRLRRGIYVARFRMLDGTRVHDSKRIVFERKRGGRVDQRPASRRHYECDLLQAFTLQRPAFGGTRRTPLRIRYRLTRGADAVVTVLRRGRVIKRFKDPGADAGRTYRHKLSARGRRRGDYRVRLQAAAGEDQVSKTLVSRRL